MTEQPELDLKAKPTNAASRAMTRELVGYLEWSGAWKTRRALGFVLGMTMRQLRAARKAADGAVIFGQDGFKAASKATAEEKLRCANDLRSRAKEMDAEAAAILRRHHRYGRDAE
jgi:hypothetical protein